MKVKLGDMVCTAEDEIFNKSLISWDVILEFTIHSNFVIKLNQIENVV